jgi:hypothetical protein
MNLRVIPAACLLALLSLGLAACGDDTPEEPADEPAAANDVTPGDEPAADEPVAGVDEPFIDETPADEPAADEPATDDEAAAADDVPGPRLGSPIADELGVDPELEPIIEVRELSSAYTAILVNEAAIDDPRELEGIARPYCTNAEGCRVGVWYDREDMPSELPVREVQIRYQVFAIGRSGDGRENVLWNCNVFLEFEATQECLPRPMN